MIAEYIEGARDVLHAADQVRRHKASRFLTRPLIAFCESVDQATVGLLEALGEELDRGIEGQRLLELAAAVGDIASAARELYTASRDGVLLIDLVEQEQFTRWLVGAQSRADALSQEAASLQAWVRQPPPPPPPELLAGNQEPGPYLTHEEIMARFQAGGDI